MNSPSSSPDHWERIYQQKASHELSWTYSGADAALSLFDELALPTEARILDVGAGEGAWLAQLLDRGYRQLEVVEISATAIARAQAALGARADGIRWHHCDVLDFRPAEAYDLWHDRATFHFMTVPEQVARYLDLVKRAVRPGGLVLLSTFAHDGPERCSGLPVQRYSEQALAASLAEVGVKLRCINAQHHTPWGAEQRFTHCAFRRAA